MITLEYDGLEQSLAAWGFSDEFRISHRSLGQSTLSFRKATNAPEADPEFDYAGEVILRVGGQIWFRGWRTRAVARAYPGERAFDYSFADVWFWLDQMCFQQTYKKWTGVGTQTTDVYASDLFLFRTVEGAMQHTGSQIAEVLNFANTAYNAKYGENLLQIGTIEPAVNVPSYQVKDIMCSEALRNCLRASPDVGSYVDHATSPPTIHFRKRASLTAVTLPFADELTHQSSEFSPREDLVLDYCRLIFKRQNTVDGVTWFQPIEQVYPAAGFTGIEPGGLVQTIDVLGFDTTTLRGSLNVEAVPNPALTEGGVEVHQAARLSWWTKFHPQFESTRYRNITFAGATIKDDNGAVVSLAAFPNRLLTDSGAIAPWMRLENGTAVTGKKVKVQCVVRYDEYDVEGTGGSRTATNGIKLRSVSEQGRTISVALTLTNGITGDYWSIGSQVGPEPIPDGLAQSIVESLSLLQFEGQHTIVQEPEAARKIALNNTLNISGGNAAWATMRAQIQSIEEDFNSGRRKTFISVGPAEHLGPGDLTQLFLFNRHRVVWENPAIRESAQVAQSGAELPNFAARENTVGALTETKYAVDRFVSQVVGVPRTLIVRDAEDGSINLHKRNDANEKLPGEGEILLRLSQAAGKLIQLRELEERDPATCAVIGTRIVLCSEMIPPS